MEVESWQYLLHRLDKFQIIEVFGSPVNVINIPCTFYQYSEYILRLLQWEWLFWMNFMLKRLLVGHTKIRFASGVRDPIYTVQFYFLNLASFLNIFKNDSKF